MDQLAQGESPPTVPAHPLGDPTVAATRGNIREGTSLDGNSRETKATHGSFPGPLAKLAKPMFTHQEPYRDTKEGDPLDPHTLGDPPGNLATHGNTSATLGHFNTLTAVHGDLTRRLIMAFQGPTEAAQDLPHAKENLPYLPMLEGYLALITFGITKEITASSQDPDQTSNISRQNYRRLTRSYKGVTKENYHLPHFHHPLSISSRYRISTAFHHIFTTLLPPHFHHHFTTTLLAIFNITSPFITHVHKIPPAPPLSLSIITITSQHHHSTPTASKSFSPLFLSLFHLFINSPHLHDYLQRLTPPSRLHQICHHNKAYNG